MAKTENTGMVKLDDSQNDCSAKPPDYHGSNDLIKCVEQLEDLLISDKPAATSACFPDDSIFSNLYRLLCALRDGISRLSKGNVGPDIEEEGYVLSSLATLQRKLAEFTVNAETVEGADVSDNLFDTFEELNAGFSDTIAALKESESNLIKLTEELHESEDRLRLASACTRDGIWDIDLSSKTAFFSPRLWEIFRWPYIVKDNFDFDPDMWISSIHPDDRGKWIACMKLTLSGRRKCVSSGKESDYAEFRIKGGDGEYRWVASHHMLLVDDDGVPYRFIGACQDIQERRERDDAIRMQATHDQLTGLPNRYLYNDRLEQMIFMSKRSDVSVVLGVWDLDSFKSVNDTYGHLAGDYLLAGVASRMSSCLRETDTLARFGGDEFIMILASRKGNEIGVVKQTTDRIFKALETPIDICGLSLEVNASCGVSLFPEHASDGETLFELADRALLYAKRSGKNRMVVWRPDMGTNNDNGNPRP